MSVHSLALDAEDSPPRKIQKLIAEIPSTLKYVSLDREFLTDVSTANFAVLKGLDKKDIFKALKDLPELSQKYRHLKRVNDEKHLLIAPNGLFDIEELQSKLTQRYGSNVEIYYKEVSEIPSELRLHFEKANTFWPVKFVENAENEKLYWNRCISDSDVEKYYYLLKSIGEEKNGCIIYDSKLDKILVKTFDNSNIPLSHAVMNAAKEMAALNEAERYHASECDIILSHEPCVMCAMALNHMRANRVFFHQSDSQNGAFTRIKLHRVWTSCHRYNVLKIDF
uniref:CMP/dCMP-type deaminase domain-containing protein n=1 Tax=Panagrolaimus superbus TaxID=310955 RepID=A0A914Z7E9_9BILA